VIRRLLARWACPASWTRRYIVMNRSVACQDCGIRVGVTVRPSDDQLVLRWHRRCP
jgi:DNA-directed RNA polymerase subunit RPC12/RpoP